MTPVDLSESQDIRRPIINATATLMLLLWGVFLASGFTGSFEFQNQTGRQIFDVITFWGQLVPIAFTFSNPRFAARWILLNVGASFLLMLALQYDALDYFDMEHWLESLRGPVSSAFFFWLIPSVFALLLWIASAKRVPAPQPTRVPDEELPDGPCCRTVKKIQNLDLASSATQTFRAS